MASPRLSFRQSLVSPHSKSLSTVPLVVFLSDQNEIIQTMKTVPPASMLIWVLTPTSESTKFGITIFFNLKYIKEKNKYIYIYLEELLLQLNTII
ncbi:hypothetical protein ENU1_173210 [Entamoeba nuttalli P19]|uniref:Uncharacterized protein n=1 Tax=Entamoeba nuttalli (strain P19) TaxID=1076696 RepID=K2GWR6_ENTNP|nr:hypothetical protein ENU1_173210 [Entamoeba nuttalli P19]EKE38217.1 hypothetical protein ENU1_173210 [Entamoeba nuttalli P19]|eukprot:XP_008859448.1 hypothetical protein ENU1_173210 [Entamoeba nuttalli P19]